MAMPANMWLTDTDGKAIQGGSKIKGREGSIDIIAFEHTIIMPFDSDTGDNTSPRKHSPFIILKAIDSSSPILEKACCNGEILQSIKISLYNITDLGQEREYYRYTFGRAKVVSISPTANTNSNAGHLEQVAFSYQTIRWDYPDGNIAYKDTWLEKQ